MVKYFTVFKRKLFALQDHFFFIFVHLSIIKKVNKIDKIEHLCTISFFGWRWKNIVIFVLHRQKKQRLKVPFAVGFIALKNKIFDFKNDSTSVDQLKSINRLLQGNSHQMTRELAEFLDWDSKKVIVKTKS